MSIIAEKIQQTAGILTEFEIDLWLVFVRETRMQADPVTPLLIGHDVTWQSVFAFTRSGQSIALVGNFDRDLFARAGFYTDVRSYIEGVGDSIRGLLNELQPSSIALNYSPDNPAADGLTHGMYLTLMGYLNGTPYADRVCSAEPVCAALRARKTETELVRLTRAAEVAEAIWHEAMEKITVGMTEKQIGAVIDGLIAGRGARNSFDTIVNAGDKSNPGHGAPTDAVLATGDLLHVDFGVELDHYCSDIQRLAYFRRPGERAAPPELIDAFQIVSGIITETGRACRPGARGFEVDQLARDTLRSHGFPEYEHALGHQLGRSVHDGGAILGPRWERYGSTPSFPLERNNVFTLELEIMLPGIGCVGLEEDMYITDDGARFMCPRQQELIIR